MAASAASSAAIPRDPPLAAPRHPGARPGRSRTRPVSRNAAMARWTACRSGASSPRAELTNMRRRWSGGGSGSPPGLVRLLGQIQEGTGDQVGAFLWEQVPTPLDRPDAQVAGVPVAAL